MTASQRTPGEGDLTHGVTVGEAMDFLLRAEIEVLGRMPWSSNQTFLAKLVVEGTEGLAIYKPRRGERPLWDFPEGTLCMREVASYAISDAAGWAIVPPTILRDGPYGEGMVQLFVDHDPDEHYLTLFREHVERFSDFAAFDIVVNNADRKSGHCLRARDGHIWGIDHGLTFHPAGKLRTVIWEYAGERLPQSVTESLDRLLSELNGDLGARLTDLLSPEEAGLTTKRASRLLSTRRFPEPHSDYPFPWPMV